jgi:hypothetical protein
VTDDKNRVARDKERVGRDRLPVVRLRGVLARDNNLALGAGCRHAAPKPFADAVSKWSMVGTHAPQEGSLTASLRELERLEEDRLREENETRRQQRDAEEAARRSADQRTEAERVARERREEEAWLARARVEREEAVRSAAMERAIVERARTEAAARALAEEREHEHRRELERATALEAREVVRMRWVAAALAAALVTIVAGAGLGYVLVLVPRWTGRIDAAGAEVTAREGTIADLRAKIATAENERSAVQRELAGAAGRAGALETQVTELRRELEKLRRIKGVPGPSPAHAPEAGFSTHCDAASGDPLCANIGR